MSKQISLLGLAYIASLITLNSTTNALPLGANQSQVEAFKHPGDVPTSKDYPNEKELEKAVRNYYVQLRKFNRIRLRLAAQFTNLIISGKGEEVGYNDGHEESLDLVDLENNASEKLYHTIQKQIEARKKQGEKVSKTIIEEKTTDAPKTINDFDETYSRMLEEFEKEMAAFRLTLA